MSIARGYRLGRALGAALALFTAIAAMWWAGRDGPPRRERALGTIEEVLPSELFADTQRLSRVRLADGRVARVVVPSYVVEVGRTIPLMIETHDGGDDYVVFDVERWVDDATP
jgi:hypothetical protein